MHKKQSGKASSSGIDNLPFSCYHFIEASHHFVQVLYSGIFLFLLSMEIFLLVNFLSYALVHRYIRWTKIFVKNSFLYLLEFFSLSTLFLQ